MRLRDRDLNAGRCVASYKRCVSSLPDLCSLDHPSLWCGSGSSMYYSPALLVNPLGAALVSLDGAALLLPFQVPGILPELNLVLCRGLSLSGS